MYPNDHGPPHFHALYGGDEILVGIDSLSVLQGRLLPRARGLVIEWASIHQAGTSRSLEPGTRPGTARKDRSSRVTTMKNVANLQEPTTSYVLVSAGGAD